MNSFNSGDAIENGLRFENRQTGDSGGATEWISRIRMTVEERPAAVGVVESVVDFSAADCSREWKETARQAFRQAHDVRRNPSVLARKHAPSAAETREHFVRYKQNLVGGA